MLKTAATKIGVKMKGATSTAYHTKQTARGIEPNKINRENFKKSIFCDEQKTTKIAKKSIFSDEQK
jgi:hypothetical protein